MTIHALKHRILAAVSAFVAARPAPPVAAPMPRHALERAASTILGPGYAFEGLTDREIQERTLTAAFANPPLGLGRKSDQFIRKNFELVVRQRAADAQLIEPT